jgi:hypothetical protein
MIIDTAFNKGKKIMTVPISQEAQVFIEQISKQPSLFRACDKIADYYDHLNIPARISYGPLGGKSYTWYVSEGSQPFQVYCACNLGTLGLGSLKMTSRMASEKGSQRFFTSSSEVDKKTSKVVLQGVLLQKHEITLPTNKPKQ